MDELEKTMPDDFWQKVFEEAAETPPPRVWNAIENRLNESDGAKIMPLWNTGLATSRPIVWSMGIAASIALMLVGGWLLHTLPNTPADTVSHKTAPNTSDASHPSISMKASSTRSPAPANQAQAMANPVKSAITARDEQRLPTQTTAAQLGRLLGKTNPALAQKMQMERRAIVANSTSQAGFLLTEAAPAAFANRNFAAASYLNNGSLPANTLVNQSITPSLFEPIRGKSMRLPRFGEIQRVVWFQPAEASIAPEAVLVKRKSRDVWASASVMPGTYNPMVSVHTPSVVASNYVAYDAIKNSQSNNSAQQSVSSRPNFSVAYQASVGIQLDNRWSVESGVGYLAGRSTIETPAQLTIASLVAPAARTGSENTLYADIVRNSSSADQTKTSLATTSAFTANAYMANQVVYTGQTRQALTNDYQFVQVPVQVGYQLRPRKRLSLALIGGFITNIFVRNTVGDEIVITAKDGIYRPVSFAATMGARFRYRPSRQWSASLAGVYQSSLGLGTTTESQVQAHPTTTGMSFGVDYHF